MRKTKKLKQVSLPMRFNPGLSKFEPELPVIKTKGRLKEGIKTKRNWWAFWVIILLIIILLTEIVYFLLRK